MDPEDSSFRWWDLPAAALLVAALLTAATRLVATHWTEHLAISQTLVFFGAIAGLALGKSRFSHPVCMTLGAAYGAFAIPWQLGMTLSAELLWSDKLFLLVNRLGVIIYQIINGDLVQDSLLFILLMSILFWTLAVHAGYTLVRYGSAWGSVLPAGTAIFIIHAFDPLVTRRTWYLAVYIFFSLVIVARMVYLHRHNRWLTSRTALPPHLGLDYIQFTVIATLAIVLFSWTAPAAANSFPAAQKAWQPVQRAWSETRQRFDNAFASLRSSVGIVSTFYGSSASLGRGTPLSDKHIFSVRAPEDLPIGTRLYWRARLYDTYDDGQWYSTVNSVHNFDPEAGDLPLAVEKGRWLGAFEIISASDISTLFTPAQPIWVSQRGQVEYAVNQDGTLDISSFRANPSIDPGQVYQAQSSISLATQAQLRAAGENYPEWISERYLQIPDSITPRTRQLAADITAGFETPYDKAEAITDYLRKNIQYTPILDEEIPEKQEIVDWFLFDTKKGFCNYYSSAEVILLRAVGIPARWAVGYAQGDRYLSENTATTGSQFPGSSFIVRQREAHSWPEVYFPGYGWVEFEPTASQPALARLPGNPGTINDENLAGNSQADLQARREMEEELALLRDRGYSTEPAQPAMNPLLMFLIWVVPVVFVGGLSFYAWRNRAHFSIPPAPILIERVFLRAGLRPPRFIRFLALQAALPPLSKAYLEINKALARLGNKPAATNTPAERAHILGSIFPPAERPAHDLVLEYERATFGKQDANLDAAQFAAKELRQMSILEALKRFAARFQRPEIAWRKPSPKKES